MSYALLIGGTVSLVGAGIGAYGAYSGAQQQSNALSGLANQGYASPDYDSVISYLQGNYALPEYQDYTPVGFQTGYEQFLKSRKYFPQINRFLNNANRVQNRQFQQQLRRTSPTLFPSLRQLGTNTASQLRGEIPVDVLGQVQRGSAERSLFGGYGNSGMARNLTARDLGLTSLNLMDRGAQNLGSVLNYTQAVNPYRADALNLMLTPSQLLSTEIGQQQFKNQTYNANQTNYANFANQRASSIANLMKAQEDADAGATNTQALLNYQAAMAPSPYTTALTSLGGGISSLGGMAYGYFNQPSYGGSNYFPAINRNGASLYGSYYGSPVYNALPV